MITIFDESVFFEQTQVEDSFRTDLVAFIVISRGYIILELNELEGIFKQGNVVPISPNHFYKLKRFSADLKLNIVAVNRKKIIDKVSFNFNRYDAYRMSNNRQNGSLLYFNEEETANLTDMAKLLKFYSTASDHLAFQEEIILSLFSSFIYVISGRLLENIERTQDLNSRKEDLTMQFIEMLQVHYKDERELKFYADKLLVSVKHLSNCVREITKVPPKKFLADAIVNEAKTLLLNSKGTIRMVAQVLGFSDQYAFGKFFKKHTGFSPKNFKIQNRLATTF